MEIITKMDLDGLIETRVKNKDVEFLSEFAKGYLWAEIDKQERFIEVLSRELERMEDKDSFKGQYLETWIFSLKADLE